MQEAIFESYNFKCPNCRLTFSVKKADGRQRAVKCENCWEVLIVTLKKQKKKRTRKINPALLTAKKLIVQYGWTAKEADCLLRDVLAENPGISQDDPRVLLKLALSSVGATDE